MLNDKDWFIETAKEAGSAFGLKIRARVHRETTPYQEITVYETEQFGYLMVIDGYIMLSSRENFIYHEMLSHPALFTHAAPRKVAIIGGGDCGTLSEVLKHDSVTEVTQVEIDERVTRLSERFFPELTKGNTDKRAKLLFEDGIAWMRDSVSSESLDIIIVDSTDPIGPAEGLFQEGFYRDCLRALKRGGILAQQSESPLLHLDLLRKMREAMKTAGFSAIRTLLFPQMVYPSGWWSATLSRKGAGMHLDTFRETAAERRSFQTNYYSPSTHKAALALPPFVEKGLL